MAEALPSLGIPSARAVVLVEGTSDKVAVEALARRLGRDLAAEGVAVVAIGGAQAIRNALDLFGPRGVGAQVAGLCDAAEERHFVRALERAGLGSGLTRESMEPLGFFVCDPDLEGELIRALGTDAVEGIIEAQGELGSLRTYQKQPAHRDRAPEDQLWGFMWNRKIRYAALLVEALDLGRLPRPLEGVLGCV
jgi:hypothetical protein